MAYYYEALNEQSFQKFAQALILAEHPGTQCLPVGQPDGGRDAHFFHREPDKRGFVVFQVKYSRDPASKDERSVIEALVTSEKTKVEQLVNRGATHYYLITNVRGTAHLDSGSIDKANAALKNAFHIPSQVWWRDDLDRRLDNAVDVKWSYPDVLRASDLLPLLIKNLHDPRELQSTRTLKGYIATQYDSDREIKFKQVDLKRSLTDLFVDLPLSQKRRRNDRERAQHAPRLGVPGDLLDAYLTQLDINDEYDAEERNLFDHSGLAAAFLLQMPLAHGVSRFVVEGAPGQGKSTVTQFLCQVNRLRLLKKDGELSGVGNEHKYGPVRTPFRLDLRDYAAWVNGRHPFATKSETPVPDEGRRSLEGFIAMQVSWNSGTLEITQDELLQFLERSHSVIVLDGFDEVADIATRTRLVDEICKASARFDVHARSLQIIVTSRPAAFANSPGFPENDWTHLELKDLQRANIEAYMDKWADAQDLTTQEQTMVSSTLDAKLEQPHLRDLARNPMQLAILLHLIHVQGVALPEKRTTLYDEYMKLFFNREAEKSTIVRDRRELILSIHGVLAWELQTQSEQGTGSGSITNEALHAQVRKFLESEEHDPNLAIPLLAGTFERVGALVSRVEGTFEFEVQPLREYFAARHLYKTSSYSPPGKARSGTRPDRFDAMAHSSYWTNVTRFFCGYYDVGELGTLVDGLIDLDEDVGLRLINQPRRLAMMLLSDHVFAQSPKTMKRLINHVTQEPAFQRLAASDIPFRHRSMGLPETAGRANMFDACAKELKAEVDSERCQTLRQVMGMNADWKTLKAVWEQRFRDGVMKRDPLQEASDFGILYRFSLDEIEILTKHDIDLRIRWLIYTDNHEAITAEKNLYDAACKAFFDEKIEFFSHRSQPKPMTHLEVLTELLRVHVLAALYSSKSEGVAASVVIERQFSVVRREFIGHCEDENEENIVHADKDPVMLFARFVIDHMKRDIGDWQTQLSPWSTLVDKGFEVAPRSYRFEQIAAVSTATAADKEAGVWSEDGFLPSKGLVDRLYFARRKAGDTAWWRRQLVDTTPDNTVLCLAVLLSWGEPDSLRRLKPVFDPMVEGLDESSWRRLYSFCTCIAQATRSDYHRLSDKWFCETDILSPRVALILIGRVKGRYIRRHLSRRAFAIYTGTDPFILQYAANNELMYTPPDAPQPENEDVDWDYVSRLSNLARKGDVTFLFSRQWAQRRGSIPEDIAATVLANCKSHCGQFIAICERSYGTSIAEKMRNVSTVSSLDGWFASDRT